MAHGPEKQRRKPEIPRWIRGGILREDCGESKQKNNEARWSIEVRRESHAEAATKDQTDVELRNLWQWAGDATDQAKAAVKRTFTGEFRARAELVGATRATNIIYITICFARNTTTAAAAATITT